MPVDDVTPAPSLRWITASGEPPPSHDVLAHRSAALEARVAALEAELARYPPAPHD